MLPFVSVVTGLLSSGRRHNGPVQDQERAAMLVPEGEGEGPWERSTFLDHHDDVIDCRKGLG